MTEELANVYKIHAQLVEVYHMPASDNLLLADFCRAFISVVNILHIKAPQNRSLYLFKVSYDLRNKAELDAHLLAAREYAQIVINRIENDVNIGMANEIPAIIFDYAQLLKAASQLYNFPEDTFAGSRNMKITSYTAFGIASQFFWHPKEIRSSNTLNGFTIFAIRQSLELGAREILGIDHILKNDKTIDIYASQLPWQFIAARHNAAYWILPFNAKELYAIYKWSNYFVHTGNDTMCYVTAMALEALSKIFELVKVKSWNDEYEFVYPTRINNYGELKQDLAKYLSGLKKPRLVEWAIVPKLSQILG